ncbi:hypothetical protein C8R46DRAFT_1221679 [Mycena filopes]|nr:hypothetical protein C8R46DRAFT_1221679 [Mycena filopes]
MRRPKKNGVILGTSYGDDPQYPSCAASFFPDAQYCAKTLAVHEHAPQTEYYLVVNDNEAHVYTSRQDALQTRLQNTLASSHLGLTDVSHTVYNWCKARHGHMLPARSSSRTVKKTALAGDVTQLTTYRPRKSRMQNPRGGVPAAVPPYLLLKPHLRLKRDRIIVVKRPGRSSPPPPPSPPSQGLFVSSAGDTFCTVAEADLAIGQDPTLKIQIVRDLDAARAWFMQQTAESG